MTALDRLPMTLEELVSIRATAVQRREQGFIDADKVIYLCDRYLELNSVSGKLMIARDHHRAEAARLREALEKIVDTNSAQVSDRIHAMATTALSSTPATLDEKREIDTKRQKEALLERTWPATQKEAEPMPTRGELESSFPISPVERELRGFYERLRHYALVNSDRVQAMERVVWASIEVRDLWLRMVPELELPSPLAAATSRVYQALAEYERVRR